MFKLLDMSKLEIATMLIQDQTDLKVELVRALATNDNCKKAAKLIKDFKFDPVDFPEVKERIMKNSMRYYLAGICIARSPPKISCLCIRSRICYLGLAR